MSINMRQRGIVGPLRLHNETHSASWRHTVDPCDEIFFFSLCAVKCVTDCFLNFFLLPIQAPWGQSGASMFSSPFLPNLLIMALLFCHWHPEGISVCNSHFLWQLERQHVLEFFFLDNSFGEIEYKSPDTWHALFTSILEVKPNSQAKSPTVPVYKSPQIYSPASPRATAGLITLVHLDKCGCNVHTWHTCYIICGIKLLIKKYCFGFPVSNGNNIDERLKAARERREEQQKLLGMWTSDSLDDVHESSRNPRNIKVTDLSINTPPSTFSAVSREHDRLEREQRARCYYEQQLRERKKKILEQRLQEETRRAAVEEKRNQRLKEEKVKCWTVE